MIIVNNEKIQGIKCEHDFVEFVLWLKKELINNSEDWENSNLTDFLDAMAAYADGIEQAYKNNNKQLPSNINWQFFAQLLYAARHYE